MVGTPAYVNNHSDHKSKVLGGDIKRIFDCTIALLMFITLAPTLIIIAVIVRSTGRGPVIYKHARVGYGGETFHCLKFRTMVVDSENRLKALLESDPGAREEWSRMRKLRNDPRITSIGAILRKTSADELPQLINVIRGEMSLVGPRPIVAEELKHYGEHATFYFAARPGVTGAWQVSGRSDLSYEERVKLDVAYVRNWCLTSDFSILFKTVFTVIRQRGSV